MKIAPTLPANRIETLDILRGISLLGIFIANMLIFHTPYFYVDPFSWFTAPSEMAAFKWVDIWVEGSFYPIFALLFGYGLNMQYEKLVGQGVPYVPLLSRRLGLLLLFGLLHALFIWSGDVLFAYAIMGFALLLMIRVPAKWLLTIAIPLYVLPAGFFILLIGFVRKLDPESLMEGYANHAQVQLAIETYGSGSWVEIFMFRMMEWLKFGLLNGAILGFFIILPFLLVGAALSKWKVIERAHQLKGRIAIVTVIALPLGIYIKSLPFIKEPLLDYILLQDLFGGAFVAAGYVGLVLFGCTFPLVRAMGRPFAKVGRMSFTTYIMQSIIATILFYSYGFGLYGAIDVWTGTLIAVGVFVLQIVFAELWLSKYNMGPLEWVWRKGSYHKYK